MSKCKAVLDGDKITEIRVKTKAQESRKAPTSPRRRPPAQPSGPSEHHEDS